MIARFVPRTSEAAHLYLMKGSGCSSTVGRSGSRQTVSLGTGCVYKGEYLVTVALISCVSIDVLSELLCGFYIPIPMLKYIHNECCQAIKLLLE